MIQAMKLNSTTCILDEMSILDNQGGYYSYHSEQWNLTNKNGVKLGFVTIIEKLPQVDDEQYNLQCFIVPEHEYCTEGYYQYSKQQNRISLLKNAIKFIQNN